jgi:hypothetical protein
MTETVKNDGFIKRNGIAIIALIFSLIAIAFSVYTHLSMQMNSVDRLTIDLEMTKKYVDNMTLSCNKFSDNCPRLIKLSFLSLDKFGLALESERGNLSKLDYHYFHEEKMILEVLTAAMNAVHQVYDEPRIIS